MVNENEPTKYCMECGAKLPEKGAFCPKCGAKTNPDKNSSSSKNEDRNQEELLKKAEILRDKARGGFDPELITQMRAPNKFLDGMRSDGTRLLYDNPVISFFEEDEQPHYLMYNPIHGIKIIEPDGSEKTPHHFEGRCKFLIATDDRVIYIAACEGEDKLREFPYMKIEKAGITNRMSLAKEAGMTSNKLGFHTTDGYKYIFADGSSRPAVDWAIEDMAEYIKEQANAKDVDLQKRIENKTNDFFSL